MGATFSNPPVEANCSITCANSATVGDSNRRRTGSSTRKASAIRATNCMASSEWPPASKKFRLMPIGPLFSRSSQMPQRISSVAFLGPKCGWVASGAVAPGSGRRLRSTLPLGVRGNCSMTSTAAGTMKSGKRAFKSLRSLSSLSCCPSRATTYATRRFSPGRSSRTTTADCPTPSHSLSTDSTSPTSTR